MTDRLYAPIPEFCQMSGFGRRTVYDWIAAGKLRAVKAGRRTLIDVQHGLEQLRSLPPAKIRLSPQAARRLAAEAAKGATDAA